MADVGVVIPAGGIGVRAGFEVPKQFQPVAGVPLLQRTMSCFAGSEAVHQMVIVLPAEYRDGPPEWLRERVGRDLVLVGGGETRGESVRNGVLALDRACSVVLIHDAARPFVSSETVAAVAARAREGVGAVAAAPISDTVKLSDRSGTRVRETLDRDTLWRAQTPQGFPLPRLLDIYQSIDRAELIAATDEAMLFEARGEPVEIVEDDPGNMKLTTAFDFEMAEYLLR